MYAFLTLRYRPFLMLCFNAVRDGVVSLVNGLVVRFLIT
jgi:hypothetical protein